SIPADAADAYFTVLRFNFYLLHHFFPSFFGKRRKRKAYNIPIILWGYTQISSLQSLFNGFEHGFFPGLNNKGTGILGIDVGRMAQRCTVSVIIYLYIFEHSRISASGTDSGKFIFQMADGFFHLFLG